MRVLVTRGRPESDSLAAALEAAGHEPLVEPLLEIRPLPGAAVGDLAGVQALLFTSANGVRVFAGLSAERRLPVFAVGDATATAAREAGFEQVESAAGDVEALAALVAGRLVPAGGALYHGAAREVAGDLKGALESLGFEVRRAMLYEAVAAAALSPSAAAALGAGSLDAALFFSPRTAETFVRLVRAQGADSGLVRCYAVCLSAAVAAKVAGLDWAGIVVAEQPSQAALLAGLHGIVPAPAGQVREKGNDSRTMDGRNGSGNGSANGGRSNGAGQSESPPPALEVISAFGGIRPMAGKLGIAVSTVQGWRERAVIPAARHDEVRKAARENGIALDEDLLQASGTAPEAQTPSAPPKAVASHAATPQSTAPRATASGPAPPPRPPESKPAEPPRGEPGGRASFSAPPSAPPQTGGFGAARLPLLGGALVGLVVIVLLLGGLWSSGEDPELETRLAALSQQLAEQQATIESLSAASAAAPETADLGSRVAALEQRPATESGLDESTSAELTALQERLAKLEQAGPEAGARASAALQGLAGRVDTLEADASIAASGTTALERRLTDLDKRLDTLEQAQAEQAAALEALHRDFAESGVGDSVSDATLALALGQLRDALRSAVPYETELALVRELLPADDELAGPLDTLAAHAAAGVPSLAQLEAEYPGVAREAAAAALGDEAEGLLSGVLRRVSEVVTVRPVGEVEGSGPGARLARAEARLGADDLAGAIAELAGMAGPPAEAVAGWLADAEARQAADEAAAALGRRAVSRLQGADG